MPYFRIPPAYFRVPDKRRNTLNRMCLLNSHWSRTVLIMLSVLCVRFAIAQPLNNTCQSAIHLPVVESFCSAPGQFTNVDATGSGQLNTTCLLSFVNDVWFTVIPTAPAMLLQVSGAINNLGTLQGPGLFLFEGACGNLNSVGCNTVSAGVQVVELTATNLVIGQVYYIAVIGAVPGTFQICIDFFIPPPQPQGDCDKAVVLCDKSPFFIENIIGIGDPLFNEVNGTCIQEEFASVWYKWTCDVPGTLTFTLTPNNYVPGFESDDLDFIVYELPGGLNDCVGKRVLRCMAAGANTTGGVVNPLPNWARCNGPTGLRDGETDTTEPPGCPTTNNNFLAPLVMEAGKSYALIVNNFSQSGLGFSIDWGGTGTFLGPEPDFDVDAVDAFECDKTIIFTNQSSSATDSIVEYVWNFGAGATPVFMNGSGPHNVIYESFGNKRAALSVRTSRGCIVTRIIDLYVEPCCADTSTLDIGAAAIDLLCPGVPTGVITGTGINGAPPYQFSLNDTFYQPSTVFPGLDAGMFTLYVQDSKGCRDSINVVIQDALPFTVEAGDTLFTNLGIPVDLNAIPSPPNVVSVEWTPPNGIVITGNPLQPVAYAPGTTTYTVTVTNAAGCVAIDSVVVVVNIVRPVFIPNVFSPNRDGINDYFFVQGSPAASDIEVLRIFDRWGALIYEAQNIPLNDPQLGWDGTFKGQPVGPGVFAFYTTVRFIDGESLTYSGSITVVR